MKSRYRLLAPVLVMMLVASCEGPLSSSQRREISLENQRVQEAARAIGKSESGLTSSLKEEPDLFAGASEVAVWKTDIHTARADLQTSQNDARELAQLAERDRPDKKIAPLLADERRSRLDALQKTDAVDQAVAKWLSYKRDPDAFLDSVKSERARIQSVDLTPVSKAVQQAEKDWPGKKTVLENRLSALVAGTKIATVASPAPAAAVIAEEAALARESATIAGSAQELQNECGQLYDSWDKILTDLDHSRVDGDALFRERLKTVRTHLVDVASKKTETRSDEHWTDVSEASFHSVENDLGMAIAHKDAGQFDAEAQNTPQPAGFSYVASPSVGSNQYGYWTHSGGQSLWTFLPQYLILRELLWNHDYHPVMANEYNAYRMAQDRGRTYYGRESTAAAPKYGTHGTFTQSHYGNSRYVQSGGFNGSAYASGSSSRAGSSWQDRLRSEHLSNPAADSAIGKRFGRQPGSGALGEHFGRSPSSRPAGRSFGRRR